MDMRLDTSTVLIGGAIAAVGLLLWRNWNSINPASPDNVINQGVERIGQDITGNPDWSLGTWLYDVLHPYESYQLFPETAPLWWRLENPEYYPTTDTFRDGL